MLSNKTQATIAKLEEICLTCEHRSKRDIGIPSRWTCYKLGMHYQIVKDTDSCPYWKERELEAKNVD